ncbi:MAG: hypothetical protein HY457_01025 [Parcubacteria group bacterium]|nr:hypothetical protein [Parcubacteria group bacterium]
MGKEALSPKTMAFYHQDGLPAAWQQAKEFAGKGGRLATLPDVVAARLATKPGGTPWETYFTTLTAEYLGITKGGTRILIIAHGIGPMCTLAGIQKAYSWEYKDKGRNRRGGRITQHEFRKLEAGDYGEVTIVDFETYCQRYEYPFGGMLRASQALSDPVLKARHGPMHEAYVLTHAAFAREWHREQSMHRPDNTYGLSEAEHTRMCVRRGLQHWRDSVNDPFIITANGPANCCYTFKPVAGHREIEEGYAIAHLITTGALAHVHHDRAISLANDVTCHEWLDGVRLVGIKAGGNPAASGIHKGPNPRNLLRKHWRSLLKPIFPPNIDPVGFRALMQIGDTWFTQYPKAGERMDTWEPEHVVTAKEKIGEPVLFRTTVGGYHGFFKFGTEEVRAIAPPNANAYFFVGEPQNEWHDGNPTHQTCLAQFYRVETDTTKRLMRVDELAHNYTKMMELVEKDNTPEDENQTETTPLENMKQTLKKLLDSLGNPRLGLLEPSQPLKFQDIYDEADRLLALLNDPQPGLMTWHQFVHERLTKLNGLLGRSLI